jgi:hypothetical protein
MSGIQGVGIVVIAAALGALVTVATKHDPGTLLGGFVVAGTLAAGFAVRPRSAYVLIPIPVLCYLIFGLAAGLGREEVNSTTSGLTVDAAQWIANGFLTMAAATVVAAFITLGRWLWARHTTPAEAGAQAREGRTARLEAEPWSRSADPPGANRRIRPDRPQGGMPPEPSFRPDPAWTDDRWDHRGPGSPIDQGARWAQHGDSDGRGYRDERGSGGQSGRGDSGPGNAGGGSGGWGSWGRGGQDRGDAGRSEDGRGGPDRRDQGRGGPGPSGRGGSGDLSRGGPGRSGPSGIDQDRGGPDDGFWDREAGDRRWRRGAREPGDQGQGDWRRRPPRPPSFGPRDLTSGA